MYSPLLRLLLSLSFCVGRACSEVASWRADARAIEERVESMRDKERELHVEALAKRMAEKNALSERRGRMREEAARRARRARELEDEEARRRREERAREAVEAKSMAMEEAAQRCVDEYWGLPTKWQYYRRLEEYRRRVWAARIADRRKRMIQVGELAADTDAETRLIRGAELKEPWQRDWLDGVA